ncbi:MTAP family purine nucleoside phosphorylase [Staphylococcus epidermidis]|jgi:S-methyl-5-thioadenosine phosphorylase|uniref:MTAP family purine nucleoside phosphorylase n=3 Tax=Staphylococcus epidermidis TaxID=1282 RepID=UPI00066A30FD|nr:MTAP family purine nucleoside phosphorylase [Staphylococcus epidermidis]MCG2159930.1 MTAP family purine nucleoside phosphorylase [Staphylococcus epidermidis]MCG2261499.1 MTAP family purine nucleoside phosphorylase [Staphylococcus epidermidis]MCG7837874.1 MTAP family purine nucleoside phosphorylase [Staphylococcus epidermidis]MCG7847426.1 MTAP family purine nucleoside phosphorylase [Staphylococcus epidermidis]MDH9722476.1 MTAP family purine nucleoside phosphorylase [Staphylococcus epidermidi
MKIGVIGGGKILDTPKKQKIINGYGETSSQLEYSVIGKNTVYTMRRHDYDHSIPPSKINYKANIKAFKDIGIDVLIGVTASGSLQHSIHTGDIVIPNQMLDFTYLRDNTFSSVGNVLHESMAEPYSSEIRKMLKPFISRDNNIKYHTDKTLLSIEGPHFPSIAEANFFRTIGADVINMTTAPEAKLCKELKIPYQPLCLITDDRENLDYNNLSIETIHQNIINKSKNTIKNIIIDFSKNI